MIKAVFIVFILVGPTFSKAQPVDSLRQIADTSISLMQRYSMHRDEINWPEFRQRVYAETKGISNLDSLLNQFPRFFEWVNDFHASVSAPGKWITWKEGQPQINKNVMLVAALKDGFSLFAERWNDIGYFRVPGGSTKNVSKVAQMLLDTLCKTNPATVKGWIIDLRLNTGGNVWFMLPPLATLIGDGAIARTSRDSTSSGNAYIKNGKVFGNGQYYDIPRKTCALPNPDVPVAILVGPATASSGEAVLLTFIGRPNTIIIGEQTAGFITSNNSFEIAPNITLNLATAYMQDRTGKSYKEGIRPDITIPDGDNFIDLQKDLKVQEALNWLKNKQFH